MLSQKTSRKHVTKSNVRCVRYMYVKTLVFVVKQEFRFNTHTARAAFMPNKIKSPYLRQKFSVFTPNKECENFFRQKRVE